MSLKKNYSFLRSKILQSNYFWAIGINVLFLGLILLFCDLKYEVSDDFVMATVMSGAYEGGNTNPHMVFVNVILGYVLMPFYQIFPQVSWYFIGQLALLLVAFTLCTYMLLEKNGKAIGGLLSVLFLYFFADDAYILVQFTKTAAVVVMCASLVFVWSLFENRRKALTIISGILCLVGSMIRFSAIYVAGGFLLIVLVVEFARLYSMNQNVKDYFRKIAPIAICGGILIVAAYSLREINVRIYNGTEEYSAFLTYSRARSAVMDAPEHGYEAYQEDLEKIGISENDYYVLRRWNFSDDEVFSIEKLREVASVIQRQKEESPMALGDIYERMQTRKILSYPIVTACAILLVLTILLQQYQWIYGGVAAVIAIALEGYLIFRERALYRVEYGIFLCAFLCICYFWNKERMRFAGNWKELSRAAIVLIALICAYKLPLFVENSAYVGVTDENRKYYLDEVFYDSWSYDARKYRRVVNKEKPECSLISEIESHKENFYFLDFRTTIQTLYYEWSPFENVDTEFYGNCQYFSGILSKFPGMEEIPRKYGIDNYFKSLVNDNVYIVDNEGIEQKVIYLQEHYYPKARAELYKQAGGYQVWKIYEE